MAQEGSEAQALAAALIQAAQGAAQAVEALRIAQQRSELQAAGSASLAPSRGATSASKFSNAGKMVRMPDPFTATGQDLEQAQWPDFLLNLKAWLFAADPEFERAAVEKDVDSAFDVDIQPDAVVERGKELHSVFVGLLRNKSLKVLRSVEGRNGYEVYRQLLKLYTPNTKPRSMAILSAIMSHPAFGKEKSLYDHVQGLDRLISEYQKAGGQPVSEEVALSVLVRCLPTHIRQHIQLSLDERSTYANIRNRVLGFESVTSNWTASRIHSEFGISGGLSSSDPSGPTPMEIDRFESKGKGKGNGKGKGKTDAQKGLKGKGKGKGVPFSPQKGKGKQFEQRPGNCLYCGKPGHWKRDCRKLQQDRQAGQVRQIEEHTQVSQVPAAAQITSAVPSANNVPNAASHLSAPVLPGIAHTQGQVRRVEWAPEWRPELEHVVPEEQVDEDLTSTFAPCGVLRALSVQERALDEASSR